MRKTFKGLDNIVAEAISQGLYTKQELAKAKNKNNKKLIENPALYKSENSKYKFYFAFTKSEHNTELCFINKVNINCKSFESNNLRLLLTSKLHGTEIDLDNMPFGLEISLFQISIGKYNERDNHRFRRLFARNGLEFDNFKIWKCKFPTTESQRNRLRLFIEHDDSHKVASLVLIDPHHLFATTKYQEDYSKLNKENLDCDILEMLKILNK